MPSGLRAHVRERRQRFINRRSPPGAVPLTISRRRLYILPTRSGALFALLLVVMLLGATNYSNSLGFALTFWLAAIVLVSMHHAHRNLLGLQIDAVTAEPVFAGANARFETTLTHGARRPRRAVRVTAADANSSGERIDVDSRQPATVAISVAARTRGALACPRLRLESVYPIGLFRSWSWLTPRAQTLVYPRCRGSARLPPAQGDHRDAQAQRIHGDDDFIGHRDYRRGDSPRRVDWKASARSDDLRVREYSDDATGDLWFEYDALGALDAEARLSQLALWVVEAERQARPYGLRLADTCLGPDLGGAHRDACLRALALA